MRTEKLLCLLNELSVLTYKCSAILVFASDQLKFKHNELAKFVTVTETDRNDPIVVVGTAIKTSQNTFS